MLSKIEVKGDNISPLYQHLKEQRPDDEIQWNFFKYLLDGEGNVVKFYIRTPTNCFPKLSVSLASEKMSSKMQ